MRISDWSSDVCSSDLEADMSLERFRRTRMVVLGRRSTTYQAARAMADNHIGAILVSQPPGLAGILTDRDLALGVLGGDLDAKTTPLGEVMSEEVVTCDIGADLDEVVRLMREHAVRRIPITENGRPVGLVTFEIGRASCRDRGLHYV